MLPPLQSGTKKPSFRGRVEGQTEATSHSINLKGWCYAYGQMILGGELPSFFLVMVNGKPVFSSWPSEEPVKDFPCCATRGRGSLRPSSTIAAVYVPGLISTRPDGHIATKKGEKEGEKGKTTGTTHAPHAPHPSAYPSWTHVMSRYAPSRDQVLPLLDFPAFSFCSSRRGMSDKRRRKLKPVTQCIT